MGIMAFPAAVLICNMQVLPWRLLRVGAPEPAFTKDPEEKT
jgi:hypothetical protein